MSFVLTTEDRVAVMVDDIGSVRRRPCLVLYLTDFEKHLLEQFQISLEPSKQPLCLERHDGDFVLAYALHSFIEELMTIIKIFRFFFLF